MIAKQNTIFKSGTGFLQGKNKSIRSSSRVCPPKRHRGKSVNVILRESNLPVEGIIADLHVIRVASRIGLITETKDGIKAEKQLMQVLPKAIWGEIGMAISFLGREICRPKPKCPECPINSICKYYRENQ